MNASALMVSVVRLGHFGDMLIFAALVSVAFGCLTQRSAANWVKYTAWSFALFVVIAVAVGWLMYPLSR